MSVDLPEPDGPMIATYSPDAMESVTSRSASTNTEPVRYVFPTPSSWMTGSTVTGGIGSVASVWSSPDHATESPSDSVVAPDGNHSTKSVRDSPGTPDHPPESLRDSPGTPDSGVISY